MNSSELPIDPAIVESVDISHFVRSTRNGVRTGIYPVYGLTLVQNDPHGARVAGCGLTIPVDGKNMTELINKATVGISADKVHIWFDPDQQ